MVSGGATAWKVQFFPHLGRRNLRPRTVTRGANVQTQAAVLPHPGRHACGGNACGDRALPLTHSLSDRSMECASWLWEEMFKSHSPFLSEFQQEVQSLLLQEIPSST